MGIILLIHLAMLMMHLDRLCYHTPPHVNTEAIVGAVSQVNTISTQWSSRASFARLLRAKRVGYSVGFKNSALKGKQVIPDQQHLKRHYHLTLAKRNTHSPKLGLLPNSPVSSPSSATLPRPVVLCALLLCYNKVWSSRKQWLIRSCDFPSPVLQISSLKC